MKTAWGL